MKIVIICVLDIDGLLWFDLDFKNSQLNENWFNQLPIKDIK
jgi:hypothetical protein